MCWVFGRKGMQPKNRKKKRLDHQNAAETEQHWKRSTGAQSRGDLSLGGGQLKLLYKKEKKQKRRLQISERPRGWRWTQIPAEHSKKQQTTLTKKNSFKALPPPPKKRGM